MTEEDVLLKAQQILLDNDLKAIADRLQPRPLSDDELLEHLEGQSPSEPPSELPSESPSEPVSKTPPQGIAGRIREFDARYFAWADTTPGKVVAIGVILAVLSWALTPTVQERQRLYRQGYEACRVKVEAGMTCQ